MLKNTFFSPKDPVFSRPRRPTPPPRDVAQRPFGHGGAGTKGDGLRAEDESEGRVGRKFLRGSFYVFFFVFLNTKNKTNHLKSQVKFMFFLLKITKKLII